MKKIIFSLIFIIFAGCGSSGSSSGDTKNYIDVFTLAPVKNLLIQDANGQTAVYDSAAGEYYFKSQITYPITATPTPYSYVDVDYDNKPTQNDIKPIFLTLSSYNNHINFLTDYYYSANLQSQNITTTDYTYQLSLKYNINPENSPLTDTNYQKALIGVYNYLAKNHYATIQPNALTEPLNEVSQVEQFINAYLGFLTSESDKLKYYSFYDSLKLLDAKLISRIDSLQKPNIISLLRNPINILAKNSDIDVFDIAPFDKVVFTASGQDELGLFSQSNLALISYSNTPYNGFGRQLYTQEYNANNCLFLADSDKVAVYDITSPLTTMYQGVFDYYYSGGTATPYSASNILDVNGYTSSKESKRLLAISTEDNGLYLINAKNVLKNCTLIKTPDLENDILIPPTGGLSPSSAFRDDGTYLFVSQVTSIDGYDISNLNPDVISATKLSTTPANSAEVYNIMLVNHNSQLFASTNLGIQLYNVDNVNNLEFLNQYTTEGAVSGYNAQMVAYKNYLIFTDGYKGLKVLRYDSAFKPMLCGVEYFATKDDPTQLAKVNSVKLNEESGSVYVYAGVDSLGIVKFNFQDILFKHCY
ncbi:MAG: hypothetical protein GXO62_01470 [Epsilonproteobacteria bacterium]|nr:hypothetical protein [Campylobacterota bacterium]